MPFLELTMGGALTSVRQNFSPKFSRRGSYEDCCRGKARG
jgi:hypothetical protein